MQSHCMHAQPRSQCVNMKIGFFTFQSAPAPAVLNMPLAPFVVCVCVHLKRMGGCGGFDVMGGSGDPGDIAALSDLINYAGGLVSRTHIGRAVHIAARIVPC